MEGPVDTVPYGFFRREFIDQVGWFDERLIRAQDFEFNKRLNAMGRVVWLDPAIRVGYFNQPSLWKFLKKQIFLEAPYNTYL